MLPPLYGVGGTAIGGYEPLPVVQPPYLPEARDPTCYTLVLDLDETLVHYYEMNGEGSFRIRPGCEKFLREMSEMYEVVIFTAAMQDYADWVLDSIDKHKYITYRLYRQHASPTGMVFVKDLSRIGRPLHKTIIVDNVAENFSLQPDNGIFIKSWFEDPTDTALHELAPLLKRKYFNQMFKPTLLFEKNLITVVCSEIVEKKVKDVREALRKFRDQMLEQI